MVFLADGAFHLCKAVKQYNYCGSHLIAAFCISIHVLSVHVIFFEKVLSSMTHH